MTKNVTVTDEQGIHIGFTYPKRASGLIKKGRAERIGDLEIRLITNSSSLSFNEREFFIMDDIDISNLEKEVDGLLHVEEVIELHIGDNTEATAQTESDTETNADKEEQNVNRQSTSKRTSLAGERLTFITKDWKTAANAFRTTLNGADGKLTDAFFVGGNSASGTIQSNFALQPSTAYVFSFWLSTKEYGGAVTLSATFEGDESGKYVFGLSGGFITPAIKIGDWKLFEVPFTSGDTGAVTLSFDVADSDAVAAITTAKPVEEYGALGASPFEKAGSKAKTFIDDNVDFSKFGEELGRVGRIAADAVKIATDTATAAIKQSREKHNKVYAEKQTEDVVNKYREKCESFFNDLQREMKEEIDKYKNN
ncbi:MAG: hypothetical protein LBN40_04160 [Oscillospiraceae bacterium]|jgi:hypothetical protein|nr:hypothetical protein [Oscillospiraceae bacterium]